jgi:MFS family permease
VRRLFRISPSGVFACFGAGLVTNALYGLLPVYTEQIGHSAGRLSILLAVDVIAALLIQYPIGMLSDRVGRRPVMLTTTAIAVGVAIVLYRLGGGSFITLLALTFLLASVTSPLYALGVGQASDYIAKKDFVAASSGLLFAWGLGASLGPAAAAPLMSRFGPGGLFLFLAAGLGTVAVFILVRILMRPALSPKEQKNYVAVPISPGAYGAPELDPRGEEQVTTETRSAASGAGAAGAAP